MPADTRPRPSTSRHARETGSVRHADAGGRHGARGACARGALLVALVLAPCAALAQYQWRDADGRMVFSDLPPPPGVTASGRPLPRPVAPATAPRASAPDAAADAARDEGKGKDTAEAVTPAARDAAFRKRMKEREEAEAKEREKQAQSQRRERACEDGRAALRTLERGGRVAVTNARGEPEFLDDAERLRRAGALREDLARECARP